MKYSAFIITLLAAGIVILSAQIAMRPSPTPSEPMPYSTITDIMTRASVRSYTGRDVSAQTVDTLLRAAMAAPTAVNRQPWRFVVIRDRQILDYIADNFKSMTMMRQAPVAVVVCGDMEAALDGPAQAYWVQDASAATENLLLAAHALGLGAVWCGVYPIAERVEQFSQMLQLPSTILPLNCIAIGYPQEPIEPKDKWHPEYIHLNRW